MFRRIKPENDVMPARYDDAATNPALKRESKRLFIIAAAAVVLFAVLFLAIFVFRPVLQEDGVKGYGNTSGNIANQGWVAENNGWVYYSNSADKFSLYKMRPDGAEKTKLNDMISYNINVYGGWVYYIGPKEKEGSEEFLAEYGMIKGALYKTREDGTETVKVSDKTNKFMIANGWIYFKSTEDGTIKKMRIDGTQLTPVTDDRPGELTIADGWIYYTNKNDENALYRICTDGTEKTFITQDHAVSVNITDGWVYYANVDAEDASLPIYKIRVDGTEKTELTDSGGQFVNVSDGWVYYFCLMDGALHKMRTDGTEDAAISSSQVVTINIAGGWIYYFNISEEVNEVTIDNIKLYRMKLDGTQNERVE